MASRTTPRSSSPGSEAQAAAQHAIADVARQQLATAAATAAALLRALDTFQTTQQHMVQRAALLQQHTAERLRQAQTPMEMMSIQSGLLMSSLSDLTQYAQELMAAAVKAQGEFMRPVESQEDATASAAPLFQAWQAVFNAPLGGVGGDTPARHH